MSRVGVSINGRSFQASTGDTLVEAAMGARILIPHDCCSGQCNTCRVTVLSGSVDDRGSQSGETVLACQARVTGPVSIQFDEVPAMSRRSGTISSIHPVASDVVEVIVTLNSPFSYLPGQYVSVTFPGCPPRDYSPAPRLDGTSVSTELAFQIRRYPGGIVSTAIGNTVTVGSRVRVAGPFGSAFFRSPRDRIVLVAGGTGWAPIWSIAQAALDRGYGDRMAVIVGSVRPESLYMRPSFEWLRQRGYEGVKATCEIGASGRLLPGRPTDHLPSFAPTDDIYVAGAPGLVDAVAGLAALAGARCFSDPFLPGVHMQSLRDRVMNALRAQQPARNVLSPVPSGAVSPDYVAASRTEPRQTGLVAAARALLGRRADRG